MDLENKGWKCNCCGKEFSDGDMGFIERFSVDICSYTGISWRDYYYFDICDDCVGNIEKTIKPSYKES